MNKTYITASTSALLLLAVVLISGAVLFVNPQTTEAYSYIGYPTTQYQSPNTYWHYNRYPYTNTKHPGCQYNTQQQYYYQYQYTQPTCWQNDYGYYQYTQPTQYVYDYYDYSYPSYNYSLYDYYTYDSLYHPQYTTWYGKVGQMPYCWNYGYCNYTSGTYY